MQRRSKRGDGGGVPRERLKSGVSEGLPFGSQACHEPIAFVTEFNLSHLSEREVFVEDLGRLLDRCGSWPEPEEDN